MLSINYSINYSIANICKWLNIFDAEPIFIANNDQITKLVKFVRLQPYIYSGNGIDFTQSRDQRTAFCRLSLDCNPMATEI